jgi:hypothetical protein
MFFFQVKRKKTRPQKKNSTMPIKSDVFMFYISFKSRSHGRKLATKLPRTVRLLYVRVVCLQPNIALEETKGAVLINTPSH